ncbi:ABC transporter ATP-binding protein [Sporosarcina sp. SAFN-015]|uniref:ABC transporter ATP-binding protein n=1 Tax=Sporosarcina sp. SAFN-015 TaxID=3387274 RepID=UPI003F8159CD
MSENILEVRNLKKYFDITKGIFSPKREVKAVDNVTLHLKEKETLGLVGESGCGKSTLGRTIIRIYEPTEGQILYKGEDILKMKRERFLQYRKRMQMVFQDPYASLNPRLTIGEIIREPMDIFKLYNKKEREEKVQELINVVGLKPDHIRRFPHEFSGGQRQRIGIARALALEPELIICDEPISALDVSIQAQIINLLEKLREERGLSYLFIAHDLNMVNYISHKISVMYLGNIVESGSSDDIYNTPMHPYTQALLSAVLIPDPDICKTRNRIHLQGEIPSAMNKHTGCPFSSRCPYVMGKCLNINPSLIEVDGRQIACHLFEN